MRNSERDASHHLDGGLLPKIAAWVQDIVVHIMHHNLGSNPDRHRIGFSLAVAQVRNAQGSRPHLHVCARRWE